jgi:hypothetical protein
MSFLRHEGIYRPMSAAAYVPGRPPHDRRGLIGAMSFQLAIPWWVALSQSPPSLHQPERILQERLRFTKP